MFAHAPCLAVLLVAGTSLAAPQTPVNPDALALKQFQERIDAYVALRNRAAEGLPKLKETQDPAVITRRQQALAEAIRSARPGARAEDVFAPAAFLIRRIVREDYESRPPNARSGIREGVPAETRLRVNDAYPPSLPLATVPARLLERLPRLPDGLEYRLVGRDLILRDANPNLVVDTLRDVLPAAKR